MGRKPIYDFEVPIHHNYVAGGVVHHNSGKSFVAGWLCFAKNLRDHARGGETFWCVGQTLDRSIGGQQRELWQALPRWMFGPKQRWDEKIGFGQHRKLVLPTQDGGKCLVEFRSADQDASTFEQAKLSGVWVDEYLPEPIYNRLLPRLLDTAGWLLYSDIPEQWWHIERLKEALPDAGVHYQAFAMIDNQQNLPAGTIVRARAQMTEDEQKLRIDGEHVVMEGLVYKKFIDKLEPAGHLIEPFDIPDTWPKWRVIDYGASAPTACLWIALGPCEEAYVYREHYTRNMSVQANAVSILERSGKERYALTLMDPHGIDLPPVTYGVAKSISEQYAEAGISSSGWPYVNVMGEHAMVERVKFRLENRTLFVFQDCINCRREFRSWKHKLDKDGKPVKQDAYENDNNHTLDCIKGFFGTNPVFTQAKARVTGGYE